MTTEKDEAARAGERRAATRSDSMNGQKSIRPPTADIINDYVREMMSIIRELRQIRAERRARQ